MRRLAIVVCALLVSACGVRSQDEPQLIDKSTQPPPAATPSFATETTSPPPSSSTTPPVPTG
jgi:hypothetical protein